MSEKKAMFILKVHSGPFVNTYKLVSLPPSKLHLSVMGRGNGFKGARKGQKSWGKRKNITKKIEENEMKQRTKQKSTPAKNRRAC